MIKIKIALHIYYYYECRSPASMGDKRLSHGSAIGGGGGGLNGRFWTSSEIF